MQNQRYVSFLQDLVNSELGPEWIKINSDKTDTRIFISINIPHSIGIYALHTKDGKYKLGDFYLDSMEAFESISKDILEICKKEFSLLHKRKVIKDLPKGMSPNPKVNLDGFNIGLFAQVFNQVTEDEMNSEEALNVKMEKTDDLIKFTFDVDCHRYGIHRGNVVKINEYGNIQIHICEVLEGGIEGYLEKGLRKVFIEENYSVS